MASEGEQNLLQSQSFIRLHDHNNKDNNRSEKYEGHWMIMNKDEDDGDHGDDYTTMSLSSSSSLGDSSTTNSNGSTSSSSDLVEKEASSSTSPFSNSFPNSDRPLFEFSDLMAQVPIKRGLSKFFQGKSQSFTSLSRVKSIQDLAKKESPYRKKMKTCRSSEGGRDCYKSYALYPKATISKKSSRSSFSLSFPGRRSSSLPSSRPPPAPLQKHFRLFDL